MSDRLVLVCPWCGQQQDVPLVWQRTEKRRDKGRQYPTDRPRAWVVAEEGAGFHVCEAVR